VSNGLPKTVVGPCHWHSLPNAGLRPSNPSPRSNYTSPILMLGRLVWIDLHVVIAPTICTCLLQAGVFHHVASSCGDLRFISFRVLKEPCGKLCISHVSPRLVAQKNVFLPHRQHLSSLLDTGPSSRGRCKSPPPRVWRST
jgi:hypothetical protein